MTKDRKYEKQKNKSLLVASSKTPTSDKQPEQSKADPQTCTFLHVLDKPMKMHL